MLLPRRFPNRMLVSLLSALAALVLAFALSLVLDRTRGYLPGTETAPPPEVDALSGSQLQRLIESLQARISQRPNDTAAYRELGTVYLQQARETGDPGNYTRADAALNRAFELNRDDPDTIVGLGTLALARHQFAEGLVWGEKARTLAPSKAAVYGVIGDAQVELGQYEAGFDTIQRMVDLRPDIASYSRVSYVRELQGDLPGAVRAMQMAVSAGSAAGEQAAWTHVQLGHLLLRTGAATEAEREYHWGLAADPSNMPAVGGLGRVRVAAGDNLGAIPLYEQAARRMPLPEFVLNLGELYEAAGRPGDAATEFNVARAMESLIAANGGNVDLELALFEAERGDPARAVELARGELSRRTSVQVYDALAWALYSIGDHPAAQRASRQALRLGTRDSLMLFHAGMIEFRLGNRAAARDKLTMAMEGNPGSSVRYAPVARRLLDELEHDR